MSAIDVGAAAPAYDLPGTDGSAHAFDELAVGQAAIVVFTCNHCPYAQAWEGRLIAVANDYADRGVGVHAISSNDPEQYPADGFDEMAERAQAQGYTFPYLFDESQEVARAYGAERTPEVFVFDTDRRLRYHGAIDDDTDEAAVTAHHLRDALDAILAGGTPAVALTPPAGCTIKWKPA